MGPTTFMPPLRLWRPFIQGLACALLIAQPAAAFSKPSQDTSPGCAVHDLTVNDISDIQGVAEYKAGIQQLFGEENFGELDCIADATRVSKAHFAGGRWHLSVLYWAIEAPQGHATEKDWQVHLATLNRWVSAKPHSVTARIALANAYTSYAWDARGSDRSDTVTDSGWSLFDRRIAKAKQILEESSKLKAKCPQWFVVMQTVALAEGWDLTKETALLDQAVAFEPNYYYYYRNHANYLKPQWNGEEGDAEKFAAQAADGVGGTKGDILYFQIASELICHCSAEPKLKLMSWPRIQRGIAALEKQNGASLTNLNLLAYMAIKESDTVTARNAFARINDDWDKDTWRTRGYFDSSRTWATKRAAYEEEPGNVVIEKVHAQFASAIRDCTAQAGKDSSPFALLVTLQKDGIVDAISTYPETKAGGCLIKLKGETVAPPPFFPFNFMIKIDPAQILSATAK